MGATVTDDQRMSTCQAPINIDPSRSTLSAVSTDPQSRSALSAVSTASSLLSCRICQDGNSLEPLVNACDCSGSIGLVHAICLEKWLSQSARDSCELCQYEFETVKKQKNFCQFLTRADLPSIEKHYILADTACFIVLTPLGLASSYLCLRGANQYYNNNDFWAGFALVLLSTFLTLLYVFWVSIAIRYHYRSFKEWQKESIEIRIVFTDKGNGDANRCGNDANGLPLCSLATNNNNHHNQRSNNGDNKVVIGTRRTSNNEEVRTDERVVTGRRGNDVIRTQVEFVKLGTNPTGNELVSREPRETVLNVVVEDSGSSADDVVVTESDPLMVQSTSLSTNV